MLSLLNVDERATNVASVIWPRIAQAETAQYASEGDLAAGIAALVTQVRDDVMGADTAMYAYWQHSIPITAYADISCKIERVGKNWRYELHLLERIPQTNATLNSRVISWREQPFDA